MTSFRKSIFFTFILALGLAIVPMLIIAFLGDIKSIDKNDNGTGFTFQNTIIDHGSALKLQGEMEFYWKQLLYPSDFENPELFTDHNYLDFPEVWNKETINGIKLPGKGYATYRTTIFFDTISPMAISITDYCNSYKLWINGKLISKGGMVGKNKKESIAVKINHTGSFNSQKGANELIIQTCNFTEKYGGFRQSFIIGSVQKIDKTNQTRQVIDAFVLGILFSTILLYLTLYVFNLYKKSFLLFGALVFFIFIRQMLLSNIPFFGIVINNYISLYLKTTIFSAWISSFLLLCLYDELFPKRISKIIIKIYGLWIALFSIFIVVSPYYRVSVGTHQLQIILLIVLVYVGYMSIRSLVKNENKNPNIALGIIFFIFFTFIEALIFNRIINSAYTLHYGLVYFVLFESFALGAEFYKSNKNNILLTLKLEEQNNNLQNLVKEKTKEAIDAKNREMLATILLKTKSDKLLQHLHDKLNSLEHEQKDNPSDLKSILQTLGQEIKHKKAVDEKQLMHFKKIHPSFYKKLQSVYPLLSQNDLKLCAYIKLNLNNKEIADYFHVQPESVRKSKLRLRIKMKLESEKELLAILSRS